VADQLSLYLGAVGPIAFAEESQTAVHSVLSSDDPKGWDNQIENEPVFKIEALRVTLIDGNTFTDSHSAPLDHYSDQVSAGAVWSYDGFAMVFQLSSVSSRTTIIDRRENFGALSVTYRF